LNADDTAPALNRLTRFSAAVQQWFMRNDLQLNSARQVGGHPTRHCQLTSLCS